ncbi:hypothetical protein [Microbacterium paludicola]|uniref:hypothetical protein n=1 Tax=Microbacterium paludicola TaxID=300019 RepID=UPI00227839B9|nr:hypothetical protein [Microbacterium paludicola]
MTPESIDPAALGTDASDVSPWSIRAEGFDESLLGRRESVFTLSNGHVGWRGNLDEGEPSAEPGSFLNGVHEASDALRRARLRLSRAWTGRRERHGRQGDPPLRGR